jgi:hypothetical protein
MKQEWKEKKLKYLYMENILIQQYARCNASINGGRILSSGCSIQAAG